MDNISKGDVVIIRGETAEDGEIWGNKADVLRVNEQHGTADLQIELGGWGWDSAATEFVTVELSKLKCTRS